MTTRHSGGVAFLGAMGVSVLMVGAGCDVDAVSGTAPVRSAAPDGGSGDASVAAYCETPAPGTLDLIDDMEDGDDAIISRSGRRAWWYTYHDETSGVLTPDEGATVTMEPIPGERCGSSQKAMRVTGSGFMNWGAGFGIDLKFEPTASVRTLYDGSATHGLTFWARVGEPSIQNFRVDILDAWSDPIGGHCDETITAGAAACYDAYGHEMTLGATWQRLSFAWGDLGQRQFGLARPALDVAELTEIHFDIPPSAPVFDIWIDDVSFF